MKEKILVIEDEESLLQTLAYNLEQQKYQVYSATDGQRGLDMARELAPDLVLLDIMLPKLDGIEVCRILRRESDVPILMLTAKAEEVDRVVGLEMGADDYVVKPFSLRELLARVRAMLRRQRGNKTAKPAGEDLIRSKDLEIDVRSHIARLGDMVLELTPKEFALLALLMRNRGRAFTREQILERLWGYDYIGDDRTVDVHIRWLRKKLEKDPSSPTRIITVRGIGYRFEE